MRVVAPTAFLLLLASIGYANNYDQCLLEVQSGKWGTQGALDHRGIAVNDLKDTVAVSYDLCMTACGGGVEPFNWQDFYQQFSSWLLPYLALISQLPFGDEDRRSNFLSMCLTIGSPTLAAYSLAVTVLNARWIARRFGGIPYPNASKAGYILRNLQQSPIRLNTDGAALPSLIVLPENDEWWEKLHLSLHQYTSAWTIAAIMSMAWVVVTYVLTVVDSSIHPAWAPATDATSFSTGLYAFLTDFGQGAGLAWFWLVPLVLGWLQVTPRFDATQIREVFRSLDGLAHVASPDGSSPVNATLAPVSVDGDYSNARAQTVHHDAQLCTPIYNYARFFLLHDTVEELASAFSSAAANALLRRPVDRKASWVPPPPGGPDIHPDNRAGTAQEVTEYCRNARLRCSLASGWPVYRRMLVASAFALMLQWGTAGGAMVVLIMTPTVGLSCLSGVYLVYAALSTVVWMLLLASTILARRACPNAHRLDATVHPTRALAATASIALRRAGKALAAFNTLWMLAMNVTQFAKLYTGCWCSGGVMTRGAAHAYSVIRATAPDFVKMRAGWIAGVGLATGSAALFVGFVNVVRVREAKAR